MTARWWTLVWYGVAITTLGMLAASGSIQAQEAATAREAAAAIDLSVFPRIKAVNDSWSASRATLSYHANGRVAEIAQAVQAELKKGGWSVFGTATVTDAYATVTFQKAGFTLSLTVTPSGQPGQVLVAMTNHGNVNVQQLPFVKDLKMVYGTPAMAILTSDIGVEETKQKLLKGLQSLGWERFGDTTASFFVKKNTIRLQVMVSESPTEAGKSSVHLSCEQLSVDLPVPPNAKQLQYTDAPPQLSLQGTESLEHWVGYFRESFEKLGWKATTENTVKIDFKEHLIFHNPQEEMIEIEFRPEDGQTGVLVMWRTAEQVKRESEQADLAMAKAKKERDQAMRDKEAARIAVTFVIPKGLTVTQKSESSLELQAKSGTAKSSLSDWFKQQKQAGWTINAVVDTKEIAEYELARGKASMRVSIVDPGFIPAIITLSIAGDDRLVVKESDSKGK